MQPTASGIVSLVVLLGAAGATAAELTLLGDLPGGQYESIPYGIAADGSSAVGSSKSTNSATTNNWVYEAFRWTDSGMQGLGDLPFGVFDSDAFDMSDDGSVVVGFGRYGSASNELEAFRWTAATGMQGLGFLTPTGISLASAVSADGSVVVGGSDGPGAPTEAFRWTAATGMVGLGDFPGGGTYSYARGVSADGTRVVGNGLSATGYEAFVWTAATGLQMLGELPGGNYYSAAYGISDDGSVIVGGSDSALSGGYREAFRWTAASGMVGLGDLPGGRFESFALAVSGDGNVIIGFGQSERGQEGIVWTEATGLRNLTDYMLAQRADLSGLWLGTALDVSPNGRFVSGELVNTNGDTEAYIADIGPPPVPVDLEPSTTLNGVRPNDSYLIAVGVATTSSAAGEANDFDALAIDATSVRFGPTAAPAAAVPVDSDFDGDGDVDRIFAFSSDAAGIQCGDTYAGLTGATITGDEFFGLDDLTTVGCNENCHN